MEIEKRANEEREHETVFDLCPQRPPGSLFEPGEFGQVFHHAHVTSKGHERRNVNGERRLKEWAPLGIAGPAADGNVRWADARRLSDSHYNLLIQDGTGQEGVGGKELETEWEQSMPRLSMFDLASSILSTLSCVPSIKPLTEIKAFDLK
ncbi:hypothetical protein E2C01_018997 [Portunus trituberculatus]|uniref:Uncharacterized protein n=1 Tax=Portunus trituberculatus TaxID=210409 RepID=A0A5B7DYM2_PORTR|nr:hypothetical protein [Portunus trituberculatus]